MTWIGDTTATLKQKGIDILQGFWNGVTEKWIAVSTWFVGLATMVFNAVASTLTTLKSRGTDILQGFWDGVTEKWIAVSLWFVNLATMVFNAVADTLTTLKSRGTDIIDGFFTGIKNKWVDVSAFAGNIGSFVLNAVGSLANTLWSVGWDLMWGLAQGIYNGASSLVSAAIGSVADLIPGWIKGPLGINSPSRVFMQIGREIPAGLAIGINDGVSLVERAMGTMVPSMTGASGSFAGAGGGAVINHNYYVTPQQLVDLMHDAETGATFARQFGPEFDMNEGLN